MKNYFAQASILTLVAAVGIKPEKDDRPARFGQWVAKHNKHYKNSDEHNKRYENWLKKDKEFELITSNPTNTFTVGHNKFSDLDEDEQEQLLLPPIRFLGKLAQSMFDNSQCSCPEGCTECSCNDFGSGLNDQEMNWSTAANRLGHSAFTPVEDQGLGNNCWAFAATGLASSMNHITNPTEPVANYSEQHLIDCNPFGYGYPTGGNTKLLFNEWLIGSTE